MDPRPFLLHVVLARLRPSLRARLLWRRADALGDPAGPLLDALVPPGGVAVDAGAGWGLHAWRLARTAGRVHGFEPNPANGRSLRQIARAAGNLELHPVALSSAPGSARLHLPRDAGEVVPALATLAPRRDRAGFYADHVDVEVGTLDAALGADAERVGFVKCDVEGHELAVLRGAEATLASLPTLYVEIEQRHQDADIADTFAFLAARGYDGFSVHPGGLRPLAEFDVERDQLRFLAPAGLFQTTPPRGYVNDFVFVGEGVDAGPLTAPRRSA